MTILVIVESPAKAKTISKFLGDQYDVQASFGHVRDLPGRADEIPEEIKKEKWSRFGVNLESNFEPVYVVPADKQKHVDKLKKSLKKADQLLLATDEDREGESISWHLLELLQPKVPVKRIVFHEITPEAIKDALANARDVNYDLVHAQESRRIVDRLYGYSLSPVLWKKVQTGLSAGRVQSVAVRLIVEREEERRAFVESEFWDLQAVFQAGEGQTGATTFTATLRSLAGQRVASGKDFDANTGKMQNDKVYHLKGPEAKTLVQELGQQTPWRVASLEEKPGKQRPAPPFTTSTLQQEANRKLNFSAQRTMQIAQRLYEGIDLGGNERIGVITYMRTDSTTLSNRALGEAQNTIKELYGEKYAQGPRYYKTKSRNAQEAHEAVRPTSIHRTPKSIEKYLNRDEFRLYELIWKRTLASQMPDADVMRTSVVIETKDKAGRPAEFGASGKKILFPGYLKAYVEGSDDPAAEIDDKETILPNLQEGQLIPAIATRQPSETALETVTAEQHVTKAPPRFTEAALVKRLEEEGIGRPSTYASIISTIQNRGYVNKHTKSNVLVPTFTAMAVTNLMRDHFMDYVDYAFTARMEEELDEIADGNRNWVEHVKDFYRGGRSMNKADDQPAAKGLEWRIESQQDSIGLPDVMLGKDEKTGHSVTVRIGRYGPYAVLGDGSDGQKATIPEDVAPADFTLEQAMEMIDKKAKGPRSIGDHPDSGEPIFVARGRFGPYVQLGDVTDENPKPKRASLPTGETEDTVTLELAVKLLVLPRELGNHPETGEAILANNGRFGPYVQHQKDFRSLKDGDDVYTVSYDRALQLLNEPKTYGRQKKVVREIGKRTADGATIVIMEGQFGPYVTDGETNATIPKGTDVQQLSLERAEELIVEKAKKPAKIAAKKPAAKKAPAKKAPAKAKTTTAKKAPAKTKASETKTISVSKPKPPATKPKAVGVWKTKE
ncbi:MAG: type I DNA topoisomerase [Sumerlaeia bacterium]